MNQFSSRLRSTVAAIAAAAVLVTGTALANDAAADPVVIQAGDYQETLSTFDVRFEVAIRGLLASMGMPMSGEVRDQLGDLRPEYLEQRAGDVALLVEAESRGIGVTDEELAELVSASTAGIPEDQLAEALESSGFSDIGQFSDMVRETETIQRLVDSLFAEFEFTQDEVDAWWADNSSQFGAGEQVCAAHILVDEVETANTLMAELEAGADFATLANEHSTDPGSGANGGDLGCFGRGMMVAPFEEAAFSTEAGQIAGPVESQFGHHIIQVNEHIAAGGDSDAYRDQIEIALGNERIIDLIQAFKQAHGVQTFPEALD